MSGSRPPKTQPSPPGRRPRSGAWRLAAALAGLGLACLLLYDPVFPRQGLGETLLAWYAPARLAGELALGFPRVGREQAGAEVLPEELRLVARALRRLGVREYSLVGKLKEDSYFQQRCGEFIYPIIQRKRGAPYLVGRPEDVKAAGARILWSEKGVAIGLAAG